MRRRATNDSPLPAPDDTVMLSLDGNTLFAHWRLATDHARMPDEYGLQFLGLLQNAGHTKKDLTGICLASVVPQLTGRLTALVVEGRAATLRRFRVLLALVSALAAAACAASWAWPKATRRSSTPAS